MATNILVDELKINKLSEQTLSQMVNNQEIGKNQIFVTDDDYESFHLEYPLGAIYISVNNTSPASLFGGIWEKIEDRFLLGSGSSYSVGNTGGSADAIIVKHRHTLKVKGGSSAGSYSTIPTMSANSGTSADGTTVIYETGEDGTGKNMPPYLVVNIWKRIQ